MLALHSGADQSLACDRIKKRPDSMKKAGEPANSSFIPMHRMALMQSTGRAAAPRPSRTEDAGLLAKRHR